MSTKLLPCPFCGGEAAIEREGTSRASAIVVCQNCGCRRESGAEGYEHTVASWNRRESVVSVKRLEDRAFLMADTVKHMRDLEERRMVLYAKAILDKIINEAKGQQ